MALIALCARSASVGRKHCGGMRMPCEKGEVSLGKLYEKARGGSPGAWLEIEERVWPLVVGILLRRFPHLPGVDAQEVAHEALTSALRRRAELPT